jgi:transcriptional regulator with XRE-family HTH domain
VENCIFKSVGENIRKTIEEKNMTQTSVASALGVSKQVFNKIINGKKAINVAEIYSISKILDVSTDSLIRIDIEVQKPESIMRRNEATLARLNLIRSVIDEMLVLEDEQ